MVKATNPDEFMTKSYSKVTLAPFALFAKLDFPPCTVAHEKSYATVQFGAEEHLSLNSDLVYINHACEPSLVCQSKIPISIHYIGIVQICTLNGMRGKPAVS